MSLNLINKYRSCISFTKTDNRSQLLQLLIIIQRTIIISSISRDTINCVFHGIRFLFCVNCMFVSDNRHTGEEAIILVVHYSLHALTIILLYDDADMELVEVSD